MSEDDDTIELEGDDTIELEGDVTIELKNDPIDLEYWQLFAGGEEREYRRSRKADWDRYQKQVDESQGFDVDYNDALRHHSEIIRPVLDVCALKTYNENLLPAIQGYNQGEKAEGRVSIEFVRITKLNTMSHYANPGDFNPTTCLYCTFEARYGPGGPTRTYQGRVDLVQGREADHFILIRERSSNSSKADEDAACMPPVIHPIKAEVWALYRKQVKESNGFDVDFFPDLEDFCEVIRPLEGEDLQRRLIYLFPAIERHNQRKKAEGGRLIEFVRVIKLNASYGYYPNLYYTFEARYVPDGATRTYQGQVQLVGGHPVDFEFFEEKAPSGTCQSNADACMPSASDGIPPAIEEDWARYMKQVKESNGFDVDYFHSLRGFFSGLITPVDDLQSYLLYLLHAIDRLNLQQEGKGGRLLKFVRIIKLNTCFKYIPCFYYTFEAIYADGATRTYQGQVQLVPRVGSDHCIMLRERASSGTCQANMDACMPAGSDDIPPFNDEDWALYQKQVEESDGFDVDYFHSLRGLSGLIRPVEDLESYVQYIIYALYKHNQTKKVGGKQLFEFLRLIKLNASFDNFPCFYCTFEGRYFDDDAPRTYQCLVHFVLGSISDNFIVFREKASSDV